MPIEVLVTAGGVLALATVLTSVVLRLAPRHGLLDLPNERSSHNAPTPRGGGIAIVVASAVGLGLLGALGTVHAALIAALLVGGVAVAIVGFIDDRRRVSARVRLLVHAAAALWALLILGGLPPIQLGEHVVHFGWGGYVLGTLAIVWVINLFNFMDGIDGIAGAEALFVVWAGALLCSVSATGVAASPGAIVVGAACLGFLIWNWAPARIFLGDVGSGYLGYIMVVLAIAGARDNPATLLSWLILGGVFFCDATVTLVRRVLGGHRVYEAHRTHAYQWLARRWHSHARATIAVMTINVCWLLPWALFAIAHPALAVWTLAVALGPIILLVLFTGAGRAET